MEVYFPCFFVDYDRQTDGRIDGPTGTREVSLLTSPLIGAWKSNFLAFFVHCDDGPTNQQTDMRVHMEVKLSIITFRFVHFSKWGIVRIMIIFSRHINNSNA